MSYFTPISLPDNWTATATVCSKIANQLAVTLKFPTKRGHPCYTLSSRAMTASPLKQQYLSY